MMFLLKKITVLGTVLLLSVSSTGAATVGFWTFDEITGVSFPDLSGNGLTGILGAPFSEVQAVPGPSGAEGDAAISLDGEAGLFVDDTDVELLNIQPPFTLEAWVRSEEESTGNFGLVAYGIPGGREGGGGYKLGLNGGNVRFTLFAVVDIDSEAPFPFDGEWHHLATSYSQEEGVVVFFVDGEEMDRIDENRAVTDPGSKTLNIGTEFNAISRFTGDIDRVRITQDFLEAADLDSDPNNVKPVTENTLAFFDFDEGEPPFTSQGAEPARTAVSLTEHIANNIPSENINIPTIEELAPSGAAGDQNLFFEDPIIERDRAFVPDPDGLLDFGPGEDWTVEAWVSTDLFFPDESERGVVLFYGRPGEGYSLSINGDGRLQVTTLGIADLPSENALVPSTFEWTHIAVAHRAGESMSYFINGELIETVPFDGGTNPTDGATLFLGSEFDGGLPYLGGLDRVRISDTALTADELDSDPATVNVAGWPLY